jgi:hypothetical protein
MSGDDAISPVDWHTYRYRHARPLTVDMDFPGLHFDEADWLRVRRASESGACDR